MASTLASSPDDRFSSSWVLFQHSPISPHCCWLRKKPVHSPIWVRLALSTEMGRGSGYRVGSSSLQHLNPISQELSSTPATMTSWILFGVLLKKKYLASSRSTCMTMGPMVGDKKSSLLPPLLEQSFILLLCVSATEVPWKSHYVYSWMGVLYYSIRIYMGGLVFFFGEENSLWANIHCQSSSFFTWGRFTPGLVPWPSGWVHMLCFGGPGFHGFESWAWTWHRSSSHAEAASHMPQLEGPTTKNTQLCTRELWGEKGKINSLKKKIFYFKMPLFYFCFSKFLALSLYYFCNCRRKKAIPIHFKFPFTLCQLDTS